MQQKEDVGASALASALAAEPLHSQSEEKKSSYRGRKRVVAEYPKAADLPDRRKYADLTSEERNLIFPCTLREMVCLRSDSVPLQTSVSDLKKAAIGASALVSKFGPYAGLTPWLPGPVVNWEGRWLIRGVSNSLAPLIANGIKPVENAPIQDFISWGMQGCFVTAIYQLASDLNHPTGWVPKGLEVPTADQANNGKILCVVVLGLPEAPSEPCDEGWFSWMSPMGAVACMHRVQYRFTLPTPCTPAFPYTLGGGFMLLAEMI